MQTPLPEVQLEFTPVATGLNNPTHMTHAGDGSDRLFVVEQSGVIRIVQNGQTLATPFLNISNRVGSGGERGLLSLAFPPDYATKGYFYVNYTDLAGDTVISRYRLSNDVNRADPNSEEIILKIDQPFSNHNGGQIAFGSDGYLYIGMGDGGSSGDPQNNAQNPAALLGKMLRIDVETDITPYAIPTNNPFLIASDPTNNTRDEIWASGLRNPWRFSFDRLTGDLYVADVGQNAFEEVNFQSVGSPGGENYGWRILEGSSCFNGDCNTPGLTRPVAEYDHTQGSSVTGGFVYRGKAEPNLQGAYLYGDFISGRIWGLQRQGAEWENVLLTDTDFGISSFGEDEAGNLYVVDYFAGAVYQIEDTSPLFLGHQVLIATAVADRLAGTVRSETLKGLAGNDTLMGLGRADRLLGGAGDDWLAGGNGNDQLNGGNGRDSLAGNSGNDRLRGGKEQDLFILETGAGRETILDFQGDRLGLIDGLQYSDLSMTQRGNNTLITVQSDALALLIGVSVTELTDSVFQEIS